MPQEQQIGRAQGTFAVMIGLAMLIASKFCIAGLQVKLADDRLVFELPAGWEKTDLNAGDVLGGYATQDNRSSAFFKKIEGAIGGSMQDIIDATIFNFEQRFEVEKVDEAKTGQVQGPGEKKWPAIFTTAEAVVKKGRDEFEMRFYLMVFDTGNRLYFVQASTTKPVREARERQIYEMIRSIAANE